MPARGQSNHKSFDYGPRNSTAPEAVSVLSRRLLIAGRAARPIRRCRSKLLPAPQCTQRRGKLHPYAPEHRPGQVPAQSEVQSRNAQFGLCGSSIQRATFSVVLYTGPAITYRQLARGRRGEWTNAYTGSVRGWMRTAGSKPPPNQSGEHASLNSRRGARGCSFAASP